MLSTREPGTAVTAPPGPVTKLVVPTWVPLRSAEPCKLTTGRRLEKATPSWASASSTRAAAAARSRFSFCRRVDHVATAARRRALKFTLPIGLRPDRGLVFVGHRRGKGLGHVAGTVQRGGVGRGAGSRSQGKHADGKTTEDRFHRTLIEQLKPAGLGIGAPSYRRTAIGANMATHSLFTRAGTVKLCRGRGVFGTIFPDFHTGKGWERRAACIRTGSKGKMDGRTDGFTWGAPKPVRPSVWLYPLVERRMDTKPMARLVLSRDRGKAGPAQKL